MPSLNVLGETLGPSYVAPKLTSASRSSAPFLMILTSSPPCGPFSDSQIAPVSGWTVSPTMFLWPRDQISGLALG